MDKAKENEKKENEKEEMKENEKNAHKAHEKHGKHDKNEKSKKDEKEALIKELEDKYMRALAEADNTRKRAAKDRQDTLKYAKREAINIFLPVFDNLDRAIHATSVTENVESLKKGIEMVIKQFEDILKEIGAKEIETKGLFDPDLHHVINKEHSDEKKEGEILEVYQKGYIVDGAVIRPARVKVAVKEPPAEKEKNSGEAAPGEKK